MGAAVGVKGLGGAVRVVRDVPAGRSGTVRDRPGSSGVDVFVFEGFCGVHVRDRCPGPSVPAAA